MINATQTIQTVPNFDIYGPQTCYQADSGQLAMTLEQVASVAGMRLDAVAAYLEGYLGHHYPYRYWEIDGKPVKVFSMIEALTVIIPAMESVIADIPIMASVSDEKPSNDSLNDDGLITDTYLEVGGSLADKDEIYNSYLAKARPSKLRDTLKQIIRFDPDSVDGITTKDWLQLLYYRGVKTTEQTLIKHLKTLVGHGQPHIDGYYVSTRPGHYCVGSTDANRDGVSTDKHPQRYNWFFT